jgi:hypothetical protein
MQNMNRSRDASGLIRSSFLRGRHAWITDVLEHKRRVLPIREETLRLLLPAGASVSVLLE